MSHTYKNLKSQVTAGKSASKCAQRTPLVLCIRNHVPREKVINLVKTGYFDEFVTRKTTERSNNMLGIPKDSMFFYAGRSFPADIGEYIWMAVLYSGALDADKTKGEDFESKMRAKNSVPMDCGARPFDSGGLASEEPEKQLKLNWRRRAPKKGGKPDIKAYFDAHNIDGMIDWRSYFALFLEMFFSTPRDYWDGCPNKDIDNTTFSEHDDWRNWTFEIHSYWKVPLIFAGEVIINRCLQDYIHNQAGFGDNPAIAPSVKETTNFAYNPSAEAELQAREIALRKK